jgi:hypothetical protein
VEDLCAGLFVFVFLVCLCVRVCVYLFVFVFNNAYHKSPMYVLACNIAYLLSVCMCLCARASMRATMHATMCTTFTKELGKVRDVNWDRRGGLFDDNV